jgi:hypothetical protein
MQTVLVIVLIAASVTYLGWRAYGIFFRKTQKGCEKCGINEKPEERSSNS